MGKLILFTDYVVVTSKEKLYIFNKKNFKIIVVEVPPSKAILKEQKSELKNEGGEIVCLGASKDGQYLAAATQSKRLILWRVPAWTFLLEESLVKRPMTVTFTPDSSKVIIADKNGDVYQFPVTGGRCHKKPSLPAPCNEECSDSDSESGPDPVLGHLSMLLDLVITDDGRYLITCDRDEKIRVSCYPNCYNIHTFCLGHTEFVSQIKLVPDRSERLVSASGDGEVKLWNYVSGKCLATLDVRLRIEEFFDRLFDGSEDTAEEKTLKPHSTFTSKLHFFSAGHDASVLGISFYRLPILLLYRIGSSDAFEFLVSHETGSVPLDFAFLETGELLAYLDSSQSENRNPLVVWRFAEDFGSAQVVDTHPVSQFGQEHKDKLIGKDVWSLDANSLYKHKYDNVADYQMKKQERLNKAQQRVVPVKRKASE